jgi:outer membrane protein assembly factor BamC
MKFLIIALVVLSISACSQVKGYFPDKSKDYQLTEEIPELYVPSDLSDDAIQTQIELETGVKVKEEDVEKILTDIKQREAALIAQAEPGTTAIITEQEIEAEPAIYVELVEYSGGATRLRIEDSMERIWRTVGKALSRHSIEIIDRNELERVYLVLYDANFSKVKDGSLWDEAVFIFGSDPAQEEEFRIKLVEYGGFIEAIVLNKHDVPLSKGNGLKLLKVLYKTIKQDLAEK